MAHHEPFKALGPIDWADLGGDADTALPDLLDGTFAQAQILVDSIPGAPAGPAHQARASGRARAQTDSAVDGRPSLDVSSRPSAAVAAQLRKEWKDIKVNPRDNPLAISVFKLSSKDGKGAWFARRSIHEGMPFDKWKLGLEREFAETLKVGGAQQVVEPGAGNVRGIGAERRVARKVAGGNGKAEVFQLSIQFPGPTTPRDFVTLLLSSASGSQSPEKESNERGDVHRGPRQFMVVSKPCVHPDCPPRTGFIRGQYESVEIIREVPIDKPLRRTRSSIDITREDIQQAASGNASLTKEAMVRSARNAGSDTEGTPGRGVSFAGGTQDQDEQPEMAVEWLMITRSDPGGSVPRFMVEKGTPGGIVTDAGRFLKWLSAKDTEDFAPDDANDFKEEALDAERTSTDPNGLAKGQAPSQNLQADPAARAAAGEAAAPSGFYNMIAGAIGAAGSVVASRMPALGPSARGSSEDEDLDDESDTSSEASYASAEEGGPPSAAPSSSLTPKDTEPALSLRSGVSDESQALSTTPTQHEKDLKKLQERRSKMQEKINRVAERAAAKRREDSDKDAAALAKLREKHERDLARQEEKFQRDLKKLEQRRAQEERKAQDRRRKQTEREERANIQLELDRVRLERDVARKEMEVLKDQIGELQAQNTLLVAKLGKLGALGRSDSWLEGPGSKQVQEKALAGGVPA